MRLVRQQSWNIIKDKKNSPFWSIYWCTLLCSATNESSDDELKKCCVSRLLHYLALVGVGNSFFDNSNLFTTQIYHNKFVFFFSSSSKWSFYVRVYIWLHEELSQQKIYTWHEWNEVLFSTILTIKKSI